MNAPFQPLVWGLVFLTAPITIGHSQDVSLSSSFGYASGSYIFAEQYQSMSLLTSLSIGAGRLRASGSIPVLSQNGTSVSMVAGVPMPTGGPDAGAVRWRQRDQTIPVRQGRNGRNPFSRGSGATSALAADSVADSLTVAGPGSFEVRLGDPVVGTSLSLIEGTGLLRSLDFQGWAKIPVTEVESGVGTGAWDYGIGGSITIGLGEAMMFAGATWWIVGDMPDLVLQDALFYSASLGRSMGPDWSALVSLSASSQVIENVDPPVSASLSISRRLTRRTSLYFGAGTGFTESAPSLTVNVGLSTRLTGN